MIRIYKYSEGEESFLLVDGRNVEIPRYRNVGVVHSLSLMHQVSGVAIIDNSEKADFKLEYLPREKASPIENNKVRACAVAFSDLLGIKPFHTQNYSFEVEGEVHNAYISSHLGECKTVMLDNDTNTPHSVLCLGELDV